MTCRKRRIGRNRVPGKITSMRRSPVLSKILFLLACAWASSACSSNLGRFDIFGHERKPASASHTLGEGTTSAQGRGNAAAPGLSGHNVSNVVFGGSYLRRNDPAAAGGHSAIAR